VTVVYAVNVSTTRRPVELSRYKHPFTPLRHRAVAQASQSLLYQM